jgi:hypothetical protein
MSEQTNETADPENGRFEVSKELSSLDLLQAVAMQIRTELDASTEDKSWVIELPEGLIRMQGGKILYVCSDAATAERVKRSVDANRGSAIIVASPSRLPLRSGNTNPVDSSNRIGLEVDPHQGTFVADPRLPTGRELLDFFLGRVTSLVDPATHKDLLNRYQSGLIERARVLGKDSRMILSIRLNTRGPNVTDYWPIDIISGGVVLTWNEILESLANAGLKIEAAFAGMGRDNPIVRKENVIKALIVSQAARRKAQRGDSSAAAFDQRKMTPNSSLIREVTGSFSATTIPFVHGILQKVGRYYRGWYLRSFTESQFAAHISDSTRTSKVGGMPERVILVTKKSLPQPVTVSAMS